MTELHNTLPRKRTAVFQPTLRPPLPLWVYYELARRCLSALVVGNGSLEILLTPQPPKVAMVLQRI